MFRKNLFTFFLLAAAVFSFGLSVSAQTGKNVSGKIEMKKDDGTKTPVKDVVIELIRIDTTGKMPEVKTDETGSFTFVDVPENAVFALAISGAGINPEVIPDVKAGMDTFEIPVSAGDGRRYSEDQVRLSVYASLKESGKLTAEQKKMLEEFESKKANVAEKNAIVDQALKEGNAAYDGKNYDLAIVKFEEGYQADPEFVGSAPVFLNNKALVIKERAASNYNTEVKSTDAALKRGAKDKISAELGMALEAVVRSLTLLKQANAAEISDQKNYKANIASAESIAKDALRILTQLQLNLPSSTEEQANRSVKIYKDLLQIFPKHPDVIAGLGLTLYSAGALNNNAAQKQESVNYMAYFMDNSPKDHNMREVISGLYEYVTKEEKLKPQKIN